MDHLDGGGHQGDGTKRRPAVVARRSWVTRGVLALARPTQDATMEHRRRGPVGRGGFGAPSRHVPSPSLVSLLLSALVVAVVIVGPGARSASGLWVCDSYDRLVGGVPACCQSSYTGNTPQLRFTAKGFTCTSCYDQAWFAMCGDGRSCCEGYYGYCVLQADGDFACCNSADGLSGRYGCTRSTKTMGTSSITPPQFDLVHPATCTQPGCKSASALCTWDANMDQTECKCGNYCHCTGYYTYCSDIGADPGSYVIDHRGNSGTFAACPAGSFCTGGRSQPLPCPVGSFCMKGSAAPAPCVAGGACWTPSLVQPKPCPAGYTCPPWNPPANAASISYEELLAVAATPCPKGRFCPAGAPSPSYCTDGFACPEGSTAPTPCPPDTNCQPTGIFEWEPCPAGKYRKKGEPYTSVCSGGCTGPAWMWLAGKTSCAMSAAGIGFVAAMVIIGVLLAVAAGLWCRRRKQRVQQAMEANRLVLIKAQRKAEAASGLVRLEQQRQAKLKCEQSHQLREKKREEVVRRLHRDLMATLRQGPDSSAMTQLRAAGRSDHLLAAFEGMLLAALDASMMRDNGQRVCAWLVSQPTHFLAADLYQYTRGAIVALVPEQLLKCADAEMHAGPGSGSGLGSVASPPSYFMSTAEGTVADVEGGSPISSQLFAACRGELQRASSAISDEYSEFVAAWLTTTIRAAGWAASQSPISDDELRRYPPRPLAENHLQCAAASSSLSPSSPSLFSPSPVIVHHEPTVCAFKSVAAFDEPDSTEGTTTSSSEGPEIELLPPPPAYDVGHPFQVAASSVPPAEY